VTPVGDRRQTSEVPSLATLAGFVVIVFVFAAVPGPSNLYVVARGLRAGRRPALAAAVGCALGASVYVAATAAGLAALLASSTGALSALHYAGGAYLLLLGVRALRQGRQADGTPDGDGRDEDPAGRPRRSGRPSLVQGFLVELGNPKVALFFLAFFPQFVHPDRGPAWSQVLVLGAVFCLVGLVPDSLYAVASGTLRHGMRGRTPWLRRSRQASGVIYLGLGAWAIASGARTEAR
jgi:threonine/homoserine/homoserine lactone efflux protein